jgi:hypothetical protein
MNPLRRWKERRDLRAKVHGELQRQEALQLARLDFKAALEYLQESSRANRLGRTSSYFTATRDAENVARLARLRAEIDRLVAEGTGRG